METFQITVPASTSNIGPGFDTLGLALTAYNRLKVEPGGKGLRIRITGGTKEIFRDNIVSMVEHTAQAFLKQTGRVEPNAKIIFDSDVPIARGLGSSATFRMGALIALNRLTEGATHESPLTLDDLLDIGCSIEKHTENCVASAIGGLTASGFIGKKVAHASFPVSDKLAFVAAIPEKPISTVETRKLLPRRVTLEDAVANMNRTALLIDALSNGKVEILNDLLEDHFHQPYRAKVITPLFDVIKAARKAGAHGGFLSGSGSTIIAIATQKMEEIGEAMKKALALQGWPSKVQILKPDIRGIIQERL